MHAKPILSRGERTTASFSDRPARARGLRDRGLPGGGLPGPRRARPLTPTLTRGTELRRGSMSEDRPRTPDEPLQPGHEADSLEQAADRRHPEPRTLERQAG